MFYLVCGRRDVILEMVWPAGLVPQSNEEVLEVLIHEAGDDLLTDTDFV